MYRYLSICGDSEFTVFEDVSKIHKTLEAIPSLVRKADRVYESAPNAPWISVGIINCDSDGNYPAGLSQNADFANLVELICPDDGTVETSNQYMCLAITLADQLGWIVIEQTKRTG